jgi:hypothetical protein
MSIIYAYDLPGFPIPRSFYSTHSTVSIILSIYIQSVNMVLSLGNFAVDFPVALGIAAGSSIAALILVCVLAHFGPRMCRISRKERWHAPDVEKFSSPSGGDMPLMGGVYR